MACGWFASVDSDCDITGSDWPMDAGTDGVPIDDTAVVGSALTRQVSDLGGRHIVPADVTPPAA